MRPGYQTVRVFINGREFTSACFVRGPLVPITQDQARALNFQLYKDNTRRCLREGQLCSARFWLTRAKDAAEDVDELEHRRALVDEWKALERELRAEEVRCG